jgi:hypothetical protein
MGGDIVKGCTCGRAGAGSLLALPAPAPACEEARITLPGDLPAFYQDLTLHIFHSKAGSLQGHFHAMENSFNLVVLGHQNQRVTRSDRHNLPPLGQAMFFAKGRGNLNETTWPDTQDRYW